MQIKTTMRYHFKATKNFYHQKYDNKKYGQRYGKVGIIHSWWEYKRVQVFWQRAWQFLKRLNVELPYDPAILFLDIYPGKLRMYVHEAKQANQKPWTRMLIAALFLIVKKCKQPN